MRDKIRPLKKFVLGRHQWYHTIMGNKHAKALRCKTCQRNLPANCFKYVTDRRYNASYYEVWACLGCQGRNPAVTRFLVCPQCGDSFDTTHSQKIYCTVKCQQRAEYERRPARQYSKVFPRHCITCRKPFCARSSSYLNCSPGCSKEYEKKRNRECERKKRVDFKKKYPLLHWASLQKLRQWKADNPERVRLKGRILKNRRLERMLENGTHDFTHGQWLSLMAFWDYTCAYCDKRGGNLERDHVVPLAKGGEHTLSNIVSSCPSCNRKKETLDMRTWLNDEQRYEAILTTMGDAERTN